MRTFTTVICVVVSFIAVSTAKSLPGEENRIDTSTSSSEESTDLKEYFVQIQTMCYEKTNSSEAFDALLASMYGVPDCIQGMVDLPSFMQDFGDLSASTRNEMFPKYCSQIRSALVCLDPPKEEFRKCLDANDAVILDGVVNAMPEAIDLICRNNGEILYKDNANYHVCMSKYSSYAAECAGMVSNETDFMEISKFGPSQCDELTNVRNCMGGKFDECNGPQVMEVFDIFWRALIKGTPCKEMNVSTKNEED